MAKDWVVCLPNPCTGVHLVINYQRYQQVVGHVVCPPCGGSRDPLHGGNSQCLSKPQRLQSKFFSAANYSKLQGEACPQTIKRPSEVPVRKWLRQQQQLTSNLTDASSFTLPKLKALPANVLRLYLSSQNLITTSSVAESVSDATPLYVTCSRSATAKTLRYTE